MFKYINFNSFNSNSIKLIKIFLKNVTATSRLSGTKYQIKKKKKFHQSAHRVFTRPNDRRTTRIESARRPFPYLAMAAVDWTLDRSFYFIFFFFIFTQTDTLRETSPLHWLRCVRNNRHIIRRVRREVKVCTLCARFYSTPMQYAPSNYRYCITSMMRRKVSFNLKRNFFFPFKRKWTFI